MFVLLIFGSAGKQFPREHKLLGWAVGHGRWRYDVAYLPMTTKAAGRWDKNNLSHPQLRSPLPQQQLRGQLSWGVRGEGEEEDRGEWNGALKRWEGAKPNPLGVLPQG